jgi:hypothetical protein
MRWLGRLGEHVEHPVHTASHDHDATEHLDHVHDDHDGSSHDHQHHHDLHDQPAVDHRRRSGGRRARAHG